MHLNPCTPSPEGEGVQGLRLLNDGSVLQTIFENLLKSILILNNAYGKC
jgi:hypothetical protein